MVCRFISTLHLQQQIPKNNIIYETQKSNEFTQHLYHFRNNFSTTILIQLDETIEKFSKKQTTPLQNSRFCAGLNDCNSICAGNVTNLPPESVCIPVSMASIPEPCRQPPLCRPFYRFFPIWRNASRHHARDRNSSSFQPDTIPHPVQ